MSQYIGLYFDQALTHPDPETQTSDMDVVLQEARLPK
jgi:hypothetical protein